jgi:hypothetical protein
MEQRRFVFPTQNIQIFSSHPLSDSPFEMSTPLPHRRRETGKGKLIDIVSYISQLIIKWACKINS